MAVRFVVGVGDNLVRASDESHERSSELYCSSSARDAGVSWLTDLRHIPRREAST